LGTGNSGVSRWYPESPKAYKDLEMRIVKSQTRAVYVSPTTQTLLTELGEECQYVLKLLAQLEIPTLKETQVDAILGQLSAAVLHLHEHTRGLDEMINEDCGGA
jgi:hypothetical protein